MKKIIAMLLVLTMAFSLVACGNTTNGDADNTGAAASDKENLTGTMEELVNNIVAKQPVSFAGPMVAPIDLTTAEAAEYQINGYTGLENGNDITDLAVCESMMGSIAYSLVAVRVKDAANAKTVAEAMKNGINVRKWICVAADELLVAGYGDVVVLVMLDSSLGMTAQSFIDAFSAVCGGELDFTLN